jgi:RNA polymerase sigma factor (sigma-70 family)
MPQYCKESVRGRLTAMAFSPERLAVTDHSCHRAVMDGMFRHLQRLKDVLRRMGRSPEDTDDLIQEAFLRLHVYCQTHEVHQEEAFLVHAVKNLSVDAHRRAHRDLYVKTPIESLPLLDLKLRPDEELSVQQRLDRVRAVLDGLTPRTREVFLMHRIEGLSSAQIGAAFRISVSAVEKHIARAVLALMSVVDT